jgi:hypothetical protein
MKVARDLSRPKSDWWTTSHDVAISGLDEIRVWAIALHRTHASVMTEVFPYYFDFPRIPPDWTCVRFPTGDLWNSDAHWLLTHPRFSFDGLYSAICDDDRNARQQLLDYIETL